MNKTELKALRERLGLTQKQMAHKIGLEIRQYQYIEKEGKPLSKASAMLAEQLLISS